MEIFLENTVTQILAKAPQLNEKIQEKLAFLQRRVGSLRELTQEAVMPLAKWMIYQEEIRNIKKNIPPGDVLDYLAYCFESESENKTIRGKLNNPNYTPELMQKDANDWHTRLANNKRKTADIAPGRTIKAPNMQAGWRWVSLDKRMCSKEAKAMGHCGNSGGSADDNIFSLRDAKGVPHLTFVVKNQILGQSKGYGNSKPAKQYHPMIVSFLLATDHGKPVVSFIGGGGHDPKNNFHFEDLTKEQQEQVLKVKPHINDFAKYMQILHKDNPNIIKEKAEEILGTEIKEVRPTEILIAELEWITDLIEWLRHNTNSKLEEVPDLEGFQNFMVDRSFSTREIEETFENEADAKSKEMVKEIIQEIKEDNPNEDEDEVDLEWALRTEESLEDKFRLAMSNAEESGTQDDAIESVSKHFNNEYDENFKAFHTQRSETTKKWEVTISYNELGKYYSTADENGNLLSEAEFKYSPPYNGYFGFSKEIYNEILREQLSEFINEYRKTRYEHSLEKAPALFHKYEHNSFSQWMKSRLLS
jgi:hypothetical protein